MILDENGNVVEARDLAGNVAREENKRNTRCLPPLQPFPSSWEVVSKKNVETQKCLNVL